MKTFCRRCFVLAPVLLLLVSFLLPTAAQTQEKTQSADPATKEKKSAEKKPTKHVRFRVQQGKPVAMQTAISHFAPKADGKRKITVDLIGVVHIGDKAYYKQLNELFKTYDVVLYELVAPEGAKVDKKTLAESDNPLRMLQSLPQQMLGLDSQLENIDYNVKNMVHADLTPKEIAAKMAERGESALTVMLDAASEMIRQQNLQQQKLKEQGKASTEGAADLTGMLAMLSDPAKMKLVMAKQFVESEALDLGLGKSLNQILIKDRNEEAMKELNRQVFAGHKKIAIFYGAAHMPDFEKRLRKAYGLELKRQTWMDAWDLSKKASASDDPTQMLLKLLKELGGD